MYRVDSRDQAFTLFEYVGVDKLLGYAPYKEFDRETFELLLDSAKKLAEGVIAPINEPGDRVGCELLPDGTVRTPPGYKEAYKQFCENGWLGLHLPQEWGAQGLPVSLSIAAQEAIQGACVAFQMYPGLSAAAAHLLIEYGTSEQKNRYVKNIVSGRWGGTMCLTEPGAGTAVGDSKTVATPIAGRTGAYKLKGAKIFISSGENDLVENIVHLVLARTPGAPAGVKGLSLFCVPKLRVDDSGRITGSNDVRCARIEEKMGIHGSATCLLNFGDEDNCEATIIGNEGDGIKIMFLMMNEARLGVGLQSLSVASAAYGEALQYAHDRIQGVRVESLKDANAPRVAIIEHPDVRRNLLLQRAYVTGLRALMYKVSAWIEDLRFAPTAEERDRARRLVELLTPICKGYGSDVAFECTSLAVQTFGGYGYTRDYPVEQHLRDARIFQIYEGTNGVQAMDLLGRKMRMEGGAVYMQFAGEIAGFIEKAKAHPATADWAPELQRAFDDLQSVAMFFMQKGLEGDQSGVVAQATTFLRQLGNLVLAWLLGDMAILAHDKLQALAAEKGTTAAALVSTNPDAVYLDGKVKTATFFGRQVLPQNRALADVIRTFDKTPIDYPFTATL